MATDWMREYNDICTEIDILELRAKDLERQLKLAHKVVMSGKMPSDPSTPCFLPLDKALMNHDNVKSKLLECTEELEAKRELRRRIENHMSRFEGLERRVAYMRDVEKKSLLTISQELNYTYNYIRIISAKINRLVPKHSTMSQQIS